MASENGRHPELGMEDTSGTVDEGADQPAETQIVEEPDEPVNPDDRTRAETEAARASLSYARGPRKKYKGPRSLSIMLLVVGMVIAVGIYAFQWALRMSEKNERNAGINELKELEERDTMATVQAKLVPYKTAALRAKVGDPELIWRPPGREFKGLAPEEKARMQDLLSKFGSQFKPDEKEQQQIDEARMIDVTHSRPSGG